MNKNLTQFTNELTALSPVINSFTEPVQLRIIDKYLDLLEIAIIGNLKILPGRRLEPGEIETPKMRMATNGVEGKRKAPGATKILSRVLHTNFFEVERTIAEVADHCATVYESVFKTSELSGILLKLANERKLVRTRNDDNNRFVYSKAVAA